MSKIIVDSPIPFKKYDAGKFVPPPLINGDSGNVICYSGIVDRMGFYSHSSSEWVCFGNVKYWMVINWLHIPEHDPGKSFDVLLTEIPTD